jgi:hemerythrin superfamily protein
MGGRGDDGLGRHRHVTRDAARRDNSSGFQGGTIVAWWVAQSGFPRHAPNRKGTMDAIDLLQFQHRQVEELLTELEGANGLKAKRIAFDELADSLAAHVLIEEHVFYPAIKAKRTEDILLESLEEHLAIKRVLADLLKTPFEDPTFDAKLKVMGEQVLHHHDEEEEELFPKVRKLLAKDELVALGKKMFGAHERLISGHPARAVPSETDHAAAL